MRVLLENIMNRNYAFTKLKKKINMSAGLLERSRKTFNDK